MNSEAIENRAKGADSWKPAPLVVLAIILLFSVPPVPHCVAGQGSRAILKQAREEKDPAARVRLLDQALKDGSAKGRLRSTLYFERGKAHKEMKDCFRAIRDFDSSLHDSRSILPALLEKTHCLILVDQLEEASRVLERVLLAKPDLARSYILKGMIYEGQGFLSRAGDEYSRALHYEPGSVAALEMRAKVLLKQGKPREALDDLDALSKLEPDRPDIFIDRARIHVKLKEHDLALADYDRARSLLPEADHLTKEEVLVYLKTARPKKALEALSGRPEVPSDDAESLVLRARAHILLKRYPEAERILKRALFSDPSHAPAYLFSGVAAMHSREWDRALSDLNRAIELDSSLVDAYKVRARAFMELGEPVRAAGDLTVAGDLDPSDGEIFALRGATYVVRMLYDRAIADFSRALERLPGEPRFLYDRAVAHVRKAEWDLALRDLDALLAVKPAEARAVSLRGVVHFNRGRMSQAKADFDHSSSCDPLDPLVWNNRGFFHYKIGDHKAAVADFSKALQLDHDYDVARYNLGFALRKREAVLNQTSGYNPALRAPDLSGGESGRSQ